MAYLNLPHCKHCGESNILLLPGESVIYFAGEGVSDSFYNVRCKCGGLTHFNEAKSGNFAEVTAWFVHPFNRPTVVPANPRDQEIAEISELGNIGFAPINMDDYLDFMLAMRQPTSQADLSIALAGADLENIAI